MAGPIPVHLAMNAATTHKPFGELMGTVEINNIGSNGWVTINGTYYAGPYQQNVITLPSPGSAFDCKLTSTPAPGQQTPTNPMGTAILNFYPFALAQRGQAPPANPGVIVGGSGWGAGSPGNTLAALTVGSSMTVDQVNQLINLLTGVMTGQHVTLRDGLNVGPTTSPASDGQLELGGAISAVIIEDRANGFAHAFVEYVNANIWRLLSQATGADLLSVSEAGDFSINALTPGHFEAGQVNTSNTGAVTVNFKQAFTSQPLVVATLNTDVANIITIPLVTTTLFHISAYDPSSVRQIDTVSWMAFQQT